MTMQEFWLSVAASIVAAALVAIAAKIALKWWKQLVIGIGTTIAISTILAVLVFAGITVTKQVTDYRAKSALQERIDTYTKGHYPDEFEKGYRVSVAEIGQRPFLAFMYPENDSGTGNHPWNNVFFTSEIQKLLNDNGYPGAPAWGYQLKPMSREQVEQMLQRR